MEPGKQCSRCGEVKFLDSFHRKAGTKDGRRSECNLCRKAMSREDYLARRDKINAANASYAATEHGQAIRKKAQTNYRLRNRRTINARSRQDRRDRTWKSLMHSAKWRAKRIGVPFDLTEDDVIVPEKCPVLGIPLVIGDGRVGQQSPTLDRIIPEKGYVSDNVIVVSLKANAIKSNATIDELRRVVEFYERYF